MKLTKMDKLIELFDRDGSAFVFEITAIGFSSPKKAVSRLRQKIKEVGADDVWKIQYNYDFDDYVLIRLK